jgi:hypothetical protein
MSDHNPESEQVSISNQIIKLANNALGDGNAVEEVAENLRHAAANFSAYAFIRSEESPKDPNQTVDSFIALFEYYLDAHTPKDSNPQGLMQTIAQAKNEL